MVKIVVFVPEADADKIRAVLAENGAGQIGNYSHTSFSTKGTGRFKPLAGAKPTIGEVGRVEEVAEEKIETVCPKEIVSLVVEAVAKAHPYEEPAIETFDIEIFVRDTEQNGGINYSLGDSSDMPTISNLNSPLLKETYDPEMYELKHYRQILKKADAVIYLAKDKAKIVGDAIGFGDGGSFVLWVMGVDSKYRGRGIATRLFELLENYAKDHGYNHLTTTVCHASEGMLNLVTKRGFSVIKQCDERKDGECVTYHYKFRKTLTQ